MLKSLLKNKKVRSVINNFYKKNKKEVVDILLFGSVVKGKEKPNDIDLLVVYRFKENLELDYELRKELENLNLNIQITGRTYAGLFNPSFIAREAVLSEGYSMIQNKYFSEGLGYSNCILFRYELKGLNKSERMRFYYSLYGRGSEGMLKKLNGIKFSERVIIVPADKSEETVQYFNNWKMSYLETPILIPSRITESKRFSMQNHS